MELEIGDCVEVYYAPFFSPVVKTTLAIGRVIIIAEHSFAVKNKFYRIQTFNSDLYMWRKLSPLELELN